MVVLPHSPCLSLPRVKGKGAFCNIRRPECCKAQRKTRILRGFSTPKKHKPHVPNVLCFQRAHSCALSSLRKPHRPATVWQLPSLYLAEYVNIIHNIVDMLTSLRVHELIAINLSTCQLVNSSTNKMNYELKIMWCEPHNTLLQIRL